MKIGRILGPLLLIGSFGWSCSDRHEILSAIQNGEELTQGRAVPFLLEQNYPNPFNPTTVITFTAFEEIRVNLHVFSDDWQQVAELVDRKLSPGRYTVQFNPSAEDLPSGEYYYTMTAKGLTQIRKMKLAK